MTHNTINDESPNTHASTLTGGLAHQQVTWRDAFAFKANFKAMVFRPGDNYAFIDGLRAIAILMIMLYHSFYIVRLAVPDEEFAAFVLNTPWYLTWIWNLEKSLEIFFVISGFLISGLLMREHRKSGTINLKSFYWRRYLRLTPLYVFAILLYWLIMGDKAKNLWANLLYVNNFLPLDEVSMPWTWSLAVEEQFYLLFPLLLMFLILPAKRPMTWLMGLLGVAFTINFLTVWTDALLWNDLYSNIFLNSDKFKHYFDHFYNDLHNRFGAFLSGIGVAYLYFYHRDKLEKLFDRTLLCQGITLFALWIVVGGFLSDIYFVQDMNTLNYSRAYMITCRNIFSLALAWLLLACMFPAGVGSWVKKFLSARFWFPFAQLSYSMYLFHYSFVTIIAVNLLKNLEHAGVIKDIYNAPYHWFLVVFGILLLVSVLWGTLTFLLIEKPFMQLRDLKRSAAKATVATAAKG